MRHSSDGVAFVGEERRANIGHGISPTVMRALLVYQRQHWQPRLSLPYAGDSPTKCVGSHAVAAQVGLTPAQLERRQTGLAGGP